jgi:phospholipid-binding lipoprotein MlaA
MTETSGSGAVASSPRVRLEDGIGMDRVIARLGWVRRAGLPAMAVAVLLVAGCATAPDPADTEAVAEFQRVNDPAEPANRGVFAFNRALDQALLRPAAIVYKDYTPELFQMGVHNVLNNLRSPVIFFNDVLQGRIEHAVATWARFMINSTIGVLGLFDPATGMGIEFHNEDFGQTLAVWGVPEGPYLMLPVFGPSNPRDTVGLVVDILVDPLNWWAANTGNDWAPWARGGMRAIDTRARNFDAIEDLEKTSLDFYAAIRSLYRQRRADEISNGEGSANMPAPSLGETDGPSLDDEVSEVQ